MAMGHTLLAAARVAVRFQLSLDLAILVAFATVGLRAGPQTPTDQLLLTLACERPSDLTFRLTLHNVSTVSTAAVIGTILANDKKYLLGRVAFTVTRAGVADSTFDFFDPSVPTVAGRVDPWLIPLPAGASYSVVVSIPEGFRELLAGIADVRARLTTRENRNPNLDVQGLRFIHVWIGTLISDPIHLPDACRR
jgi:hypothetical protein